jgi:hypothetical protein
MAPASIPPTSGPSVCCKCNKKSAGGKSPTASEGLLQMPRSASPLLKPEAYTLRAHDTHSQVQPHHPLPSPPPQAPTVAAATRRAYPVWSNNSPSPAFRVTSA